MAPSLLLASQLSSLPFLTWISVLPQNGLPAPYLQCVCLFSPNTSTRDAKQIFPKATLLLPLCSKTFRGSSLPIAVGAISSLWHSRPHPPAPWAALPRLLLPSFLDENSAQQSHITCHFPDMDSAAHVHLQALCLTCALQSPCAPVQPSLQGSSNAISCRKNSSHLPPAVIIFPMNSQNMEAWTCPETLPPGDPALWTFVGRC